MDPAELLEHVDGLVDDWCDRRALRALREILAGYPLTSPLTDSWAELLKALEAVRAFAHDELVGDEAESIDVLIGAATAIVHRR